MPAAVLQAALSCSAGLLTGPLGPLAGAPLHLAPALLSSIHLLPALSPPAAAVLFYDLFDLQTFQTRLAAPAGAAAEAEPDWEAIEAAVQQLEASLGPGEQFTRSGACRRLACI